MVSASALRSKIAKTNPRSAWDKGVKKYAIELLEDAGNTDLTKSNVKRVLLNGATDWADFSYGGCSLVYNEEIARRTCNKSELKKIDYGRKRPNAKEIWLDTQARALYQAEMLIRAYL